MDLSALLASLAGLFKFDGALVKTGEITGIKANEVSAIKTGDISIASRLREIHISAIDKSNHVENLTVNFVPINNHSYQVNLILDAPDQVRKLFNVPAAEPRQPVVMNAPQRIALGVGTHFIVNDPGWFQGAQNFPASSQCVLVPVTSPDSESTVRELLELTREIGVVFQGGVPAKLSLTWGDPNHVDVVHDKPVLLGNSEWVFSQLSIEQPVYLDQRREVVLTADAKLVASVWRLERIHKPASEHNPRPSQQFIFIVKKDGEHLPAP